MTSSHSAAPLADMRILDLSRLVAGNITSHVLADLGADVVKVETLPLGDDLRNWRKDGVSTFWKLYSRNKRSIALNLRDSEGVTALLRLVKGASAFIENFRPGTLEKMGLGPDALLAINPNLIILRISGWGQTGPYSHKPGFGSLIEAMSGFAAMNGYADRPPVLPPFALADSVAGLYGALALLNALRHVDRGGGGQVIDLSLFDPVFSVLGPWPLEYMLNGDVPARAGSRSPTHAPRNVYETADGKHIAISAGMEGVVQRLFVAMDRPELVDDPRFSSHAARIVNIDALDATIGTFIRTRSLADNLAFFEKTDVTAGPVATVADLVDHPYLRERGVLVEQSDRDLGSILAQAPPLRFSGTPATIRFEAPTLGEHSAELLAEAGFSQEEIQTFMARGAALGPEMSPQAASEKRHAN
jgi:crotonobetainyl-CoA:carnitine CoA-transferase CaiB-like acyl-CoA transferase